MCLLGLCVIVALGVQDVFACDLQITKTALALKGKTDHEAGLCLANYFNERDLGVNSMSREAVSSVMVNDKITMYFSDEILFWLTEIPGKSLEEAGRLKIVEDIYSQYFASLKNNGNQCSLRLFDGDRRLSLKDFKITARVANDQPGSRVMLNKDDVKNPFWDLVCLNSSGFAETTKSGSYFFMFVDVYENKTLKSTDTHYSKFLFSLH